jgi:spore coat protein U-like protein
MRKLVRTLQCAAKSALRPSRLVLPMVAAGLMSITGAQAASQSASFDTTITLTSACVLGTINDVVVAYTSFSPTAVTTAGTSASISCTSGLPYTASLDLGSSGDDSLGLGRIAYTDPVINLPYRLTLSGAGFVPAAAPNGGAMARTGNGLANTLAIDVRVNANQVGTCTTATCGNAGPARQRTLLVSW